MAFRVEGRRLYIEGNTYPLRYKLAGVLGWDHFDREQSAWWCTDATRERVEAIMAEVPPCRYHKVGDEWRVVGSGPAPAVGASVTVLKASGDTKTEIVSQVFVTSADTWEATVQKKARAARGTGVARRSRSNDYDRPMPGCSDCRRLGRMCKQCAFDEYDC